METKNKTAKGATKSTSKTVVKTSVVKPIPATKTNKEKIAENLKNNKKPVDPAKKAASEKSKKEVAEIKAKTAVKTPEEIAKEKKEIEAGIIAARKAEKEKKEPERKTRLDAKKEESKKNKPEKYSRFMAVCDYLKSKEFKKNGATLIQIQTVSNDMFVAKGGHSTMMTSGEIGFFLNGLVYFGGMLTKENGIYKLVAD